MPKKIAARTNSLLWLGVAALGFLIALIVLAQAAYTKPEKIFWDMIDNSLSTRGVVRTVIQSGESGRLEQMTLLRFGSDNVARSLVTLNQKDAQTKSIINTETIGTADTDYNRYLSINTTQKSSNGQPLNFKSVIGVWGKSVKSEGQSAQLMSQTAFGLVPFANLNNAQRSQTIEFIQKKKAYQIDFRLVKSKKESGQSAYLYKINLDPQAYVQVLQRLTKITGLTPIDGLDPQAYANSQPISLTFVVAKNSRQLLKINYDNGTQEERYSGYGLVNSIDLPDKTIPLSKLQERIQSIR